MIEKIARMISLVFTISLTFCLFTEGYGSRGDQSGVHIACMHRCTTVNCSSEYALSAFDSRQPWYLKLLYWDCNSECDYQCMWETVSLFSDMEGRVPQFHGKWPFYRFFGIQEPASVLFSLLNGFAHIVMWRRFRRRVSKAAPFFNLWKFQAIISVNAWFWSAVFHTRDTPLTEKLDYICAFSLVLYSLYSLCVRMLGSRPVMNWSTVAVPFLAFFAYHIHYLTMVHFDYSYHMAASVACGALNCCGWLTWCWWHRRRRFYVWQGALVVLFLWLLLGLEVSDFSPWKFVLDAHALWHLATSPLPLLWYRFLMEDCLYEWKLLWPERQKSRQCCTTKAEQDANQNGGTGDVINGGGHVTHNSSCCLFSSQELPTMSQLQEAARANGGIIRFDSDIFSAVSCCCVSADRLAVDGTTKSNR